MKKTLFIALLVFAVPFLRAQDKPSPEKYMNKRLAALREKLMLTDTEYAGFSKAYREYFQARRRLKEEMKTLRKELDTERAVNLPDKEIERKLQRLRQLEKEMFQLRQQHWDRVQRILPPRKQLAYWRMLNRKKHYMPARFHKDKYRHDHKKKFFHGKKWDED